MKKVIFIIAVASFLTGCSSVYGPMPVKENVYFVGAKKDIPSKRVDALKASVDFCQNLGGKHPVAVPSEEVETNAPKVRRGLFMYFKCE